METCGIVPPPRSSDSTSCPYGIESLLKTTRPAITPVTAPVAPYTPYPVLRIAALHPFSNACYTFADRRRSPGLAALPVSTQTTPTLTRTGLPVETGDIRWPADIFREIRSKTSPLNFSTSVKSPRKRVRKSIEANAPLSDEEKSSIQSLDTKVTKSSDLKFGIDRILNIDEDCQFHEPSDDSSDEYSSDSVDSQIDVESQSPVILPQPIITTSLPSRFPLLPTAIFPPLFGPGMHPNILPGLQQAASRCCPLQRQLMVQHPAFRMNPCTPRSRGVACQPEYPGPYAALTSGCSANSFIRGECSDSKRKRSWSRAVFSSLQRKGLEKRFDVQKYVTKPDRRQLAGLLGLTDAQVKVWFQNRRMKWRHTEDAKRGTSGTELNSSSSSCVQRNALNAESPLHRSVDSDDSDLSPGQPSSPPLIPNPATVPLEESKLILASDLYSIRKF